MVGLLALALPPRWRAPATALVPLAGLAVGPGLDVAVGSWDRPGVLAAAVIAIGAGFAAAGGASAAEPLGPVGTAWSLAAVAGGTVLAVPDTEGPVLACGALGAVAVVATATDRRSPGAWPVAEAPAAVGAAAVAVVAVAGATAGIVAAVGALGCTAVLLAAGPLGRRPARPAVPPWVAVPVVALFGTAVARLGALGPSSARALVVTVAAVGLAWGALEAGAALTSGPAPPRR